MIKAHLTTTIGAQSPADKLVNKQYWLICFMLLLVISFIPMQPVKAVGISFNAPVEFSDVMSQDFETDSRVDCHGTDCPDDCTSSHCAAPIPDSLSLTADPINSGLNSIVQLDLHDFLTSPLQQPPKLSVT